MSELLLTYEPVIRASFFIGVLLIMALWELRSARRLQTINRIKRWPHNLLIVVVDTLAVRLVFPMVAIGAAFFAAEQGWGLLNLISLHYGISVLLAIVILDLVIYFQHRMFHAIPWLWRLHRMHHADLEFDVTTGLRFHPLEILLSMGLKIVVVIALGAPPVAVLIFEVLLNATAMFNHANIYIPESVDHYLRRFIVTPDMHRVHHSILPQETDSNFGFNLPWWDRIFKTYTDQPSAGHSNMTIGIEDFRDPEQLKLNQMLIQPFRSNH
ncbi:MAG: sterol desaturase family protein [Gammaproteobacteria bacterium]|nr:sterol desaturase family protein [Gammaproteobacteria bacterium]